MNGQGLAAFTAGAAPGVAKGIGDSYKSYQADRAQDVDNAAMAQMTGGDPTHPMADANHPLWSILGRVAGAPQGTPQPSPIPQMPDVNVPLPPIADAPQMLADGGTVTDAHGNPIQKSTTGELIVQGAKDLMHAMVPDGGAKRAADAIQTRNAQAHNVDGYASGGMVRENYGIPVHSPSFEHGPAIPVGPNSGIVPASTEGQLLTMDAGGVVPDGYTPQPGISGIPMTGPAAGFVQGFQGGQTIGRNLRQAWLEHESRSDAAEDAYHTAMIGSQDPEAGDHPQGVLGQAKDAVEGFFHHLHGISLDDNHKPNNAAAPAAIDAPAAAAPAGGPAPSPVPTAGGAPAGGPVPAAPAPAPATAGGGPAVAAQPQQGQSQPVSPVQQQATADAVKQVAADPNVAAGVPAKPHSITPPDWDHLNYLKAKAVRSAALAGEDPAKVYESLTAMQTAHFQGQLLKQAATGLAAYNNGDMEAVKQSIKNMNYYLPNGQDIDIKQATANDVAKDPSLKVGDVMHANPFYGMYGHQNEPEYIKVDAPYLQNLGTALLDPRTANEAMLKSYSAQQEAMSKNKTAEGALLAGSGKNKIGTADLQNAQTRAAGAPVDNQLKQAHARLYLSEAGLADRKPIGPNGTGPKVTQASVRARQNDVANYIDNAILGRKVPEPTTINGKVNLSTAAGHNVAHPELVPAVLKGLNDDQQLRVKQYGSSFAAANPEMSKEDAAEYAARIVRMEGMAKGPTHPGPDGKPQKDFIADDPKQPGVVHLWVGNRYRSFYTQPNVTDEEAPQASPVLSSGGGDEGSSAPEANTSEIQEE